MGPDFPASTQVAPLESRSAKGQETVLPALGAQSLEILCSIKKMMRTETVSAPVLMANETLLLTKQFVLG